MSKEKSPVLALSIFLALLTGVVLLEGGCIFWLYREVATLKSHMETRVQVKEVEIIYRNQDKKEEKGGEEFKVEPIKKGSSSCYLVT